MNQLNLAMIELAIDRFQGVSNCIRFERLMKVARDQFHFWGTDEQAFNYLNNSSCFEIEKRDDPQSGSTVWVVRDCRVHDKN